MGIDENALDVRLAQPKSAMNLFSLDTCCLTRKVIFLVGTIRTPPSPGQAPKMKICDAGGWMGAEFNGAQLPLFDKYGTALSN